jgi:hypothetical protein
MPRPEYLICLECETEVEDFTWREGEVRRAACEVCGNSDPDAFALPEQFDQDSEDEEEDEEGEEELVEDYDELEDQDEE